MRARATIFELVSSSRSRRNPRRVKRTQDEQLSVTTTNRQAAAADRHKKSD
jgi:hypothetical protein